MKAYVGLGSNEGCRKQNLEKAVNYLSKSFSGAIRCSSVYENQALLPDSAPENWNQLFLNAVVEIETDMNPLDLLSELQNIELRMGRSRLGHWSPRNIDLDLLEYGDISLTTESLTIPHKAINQRNFVVAPLKDLKPQKYFENFKQLEVPLPQWMQIVNITPDSFSGDGQYLKDESNFEKSLQQAYEFNVQILDLGAESTRPGAQALNSEEEWSRLSPYIDQFHNFFATKFFKPLLSIDTYHTQTAIKAIERGADIINDVSALSDPNMLEVLKSSSCRYVLMHSLSVPADPTKFMSRDCDIVEELKKWLEAQLETLIKNKIDLSRIIFDPGVGFGKTASQSREILSRLKELKALPVSLMIGHSRKSFLNPISKAQFLARDAESIGVTLALTDQPVSIFRVHNALEHQKAWLAYQYIKER